MNGFGKPVPKTERFTNFFIFTSETKAFKPKALDVSGWWKQTTTYRCGLLYCQEKKHGKRISGSYRIGVALSET